MKIIDVIEKYTDAAIEQIAADKVTEPLNLRLPRSILNQEVASTLGSLSYVAGALAPSKPPTYSFIKILIDSPENSAPIEGFQERVLQFTGEMTEHAKTGKGLSPDKNYDLYIKLLKFAWESNHDIDRSEALLLEALRNELGISTREHLLLEHHPEIRKIWDNPESYISARNHLLITGLVATHENNYLIGDEVLSQIKRAWNIDLSESSYRRMLNVLKIEQLYVALNNIGLQLSGTKESRVTRIIEALIPPSEILNIMSIDELRNVARNNGIQISGRKNELIANIIDYFDRDLDLKKEQNNVNVSPIPIEREQRKLSEEIFSKLLQNLTNDQLYDLLNQSSLKSSGIKEEKISRIIESNWSDYSILNRLTKIDLSNLCRKLYIPISGIKNELVERLIEEAQVKFSESTVKAIVEDQRSMLDAKTQNNTAIERSSRQVDQPGKLPNIESVRKEFFFLEKDELIILALLKESKSLTEQEIEIHSNLYDLGWFLIKAHMYQLITKLKTNGLDPIHIRSVRNVNIYEWYDGKKDKTIDLGRDDAREIIDAMRHGVVPDKNLDFLIVGHVKERSHLKDLLIEAKNDKSQFKFIRGPYGSGKTFLSSWLRESALNEGFVVSNVTIGPDQPLSDLPVFYSGMINGLRIPEKRESCALADIIESWLLSFQKKVITSKAYDINSKDNFLNLVESGLESELSFLSEIDPDFTPALRAFYHARYINNPVLASTALAWLSGSKSISAKMLNDVGVRGFLESNQVFPRIRAFLKLIKASQYSGLLLILDELELIRRFPSSKQREEALEIIRLLIDEAGRNNLPGCLLIFTGTDTFFEDDRTGIKSYEALSERISIAAPFDGIFSVKQPVICLNGLDQPKLLSVITRIRDLHSTAYQWNASERFSESVLIGMIQKWTSFGEDSVSRKPRPVIRDFIQILDICEENPDITYDKITSIDKPSKDMTKEITSILAN